MEKSTLKLTLVPKRILVIVILLQPPRLRKLSELRSHSDIPRLNRYTHESILKSDPESC